jgi:hypothetical protein
MVINFAMTRSLIFKIVDFLNSKLYYYFLMDQNFFLFEFDEEGSFK